jgi:Gpi18-like mannosyltransferase
MHSSTDSTPESPLHTPAAAPLAPAVTPPAETASAVSSVETSSWLKWRHAAQEVLPIYLATHLAFLLLTYCATLFTLGNFSSKALRVHSFVDAWSHWDTGQYIHIATFGYDQSWRLAFFPLYPLLEKGGTFLTHDPFVAGLLISNLAGLGLLVVLYRLVEHDFDAEQAWRTALYLAVFPTAFFLATAYNESLFLLLTVLSFFFMRQANWWLAGLCGLLAALTRSVGLLLFVPFCYEYLRQHRFHLKALRLDLLAGALIPAGLGLYALYGFLQFHDALAFSHAETLWNRRLQVPWYAFLEALHQIQLNRLLSFISIHNVLDLSACLFIFVLLVLSWVGPWKFSREQRAYSLYAAGLYGWLLLFPTLGNTPLASYSRYMLEVFPAFIVLAAIGRKRQPNLYYLTLSVTLLSFLLLLFLTGHWMV